MITELLQETEQPVNPVPADKNPVALYTVYLARTLKTTSVTQYVNIAKLLHLECGLSNHYKDLWGTDRVKRCEVLCKLSISAHGLLFIRGKLNFSQQTDVTFEAASLVLFFSCLHKSNHFSHTAAGFGPSKQLMHNLFFGVGGGGWDRSISFNKREQNQSEKGENASDWITMPSPHPLAPHHCCSHGIWLKW